ncbi:tRNA epoxyqueuosine(34) reductase QueG [Dysgonomonas sp. 25]|uniref:tRNA epoxyqueuosine(34) reductase QueG n=1 Tax=Dysgonomonas sp. 25 TaxID=2302933 RepID=UPI0013D71251|nr:tRNA epoxyqueuosine(34) reductase QueG [Dysgonomonas sp. 25]NDV67352.1 tRNA epoxyqueuosine(34) reductase QueG [Dysgonomonas sp. 25]
MPDKREISQKIKDLAAEIGFDACGICSAGEVDSATKSYLKKWLDESYQADMHYMENHWEKRCNPAKLVEGTKSVVCLAINYYPARKQPSEHPQFAYYAYGKDYHDVMKANMQELFDKIKVFIPNLEGRMFCDTAPLLERYWAAKAGIGFIGKNSLLIIPHKGSYFFLGELLLNIELAYDEPLGISCGNCNRCIESCPTQAIVSPYVVDSNKCISYQTIENKGSISRSIIPNLQNRLYGCDICQQACPWNRFALPHTVAEFEPSDAFLSLSTEKLESLSVEEYRTIFKGSAVKRAKYEGLKRNLEAIKQSLKNVN